MMEAVLVISWYIPGQLYVMVIIRAGSIFLLGMLSFIIS
jgi:hypothetical protein